MCPQCVDDHAAHVPTVASPRAEPDAEQLLRCSECSCLITVQGEAWPPPEGA